MNVCIIVIAAAAAVIFIIFNNPKLYMSQGLKSISWNQNWMTIGPDRRRRRQYRELLSHFG